MQKKKRTVFVITNQSYGEIILVTPDDHIKDEAIAKELKGYDYNDEDIARVQSGEFFDDPVMWESVIYKDSSTEEDEETEVTSPPIMGLEIDGVLFKDNEEELAYDEFIAMIEAKGILFGGLTKPIDVAN